MARDRAHNDDTPEMDELTEMISSVRGWTARLYPIVGAALVALFLLFSSGMVFEWVNDEEWVVIEYPWGGYEVYDTPGFKWQCYGKVTKYPRYIDAYFSKAVDEGGAEDHSIRVTFNDGGWGHTSHHLRVHLATSRDKRLLTHRHFAGEGINGIKASIEFHLATAAKNTGPLMSASEHHAQRRAEFYQVVRSQLNDGLYAFERVEQRVDRNLADQRVVSGEKTDRIFITRIKRDKDGQPLIVAPSPLREYEMTVEQYQQTDATYDDDTLQQIAAKRDSYQKAESAKAATRREQQELLKVVEQGKLGVANVTAEINQKKKEALVQADRDIDVAKITQREAVTKAEQAVAVAGEDLKRAQTELDISKIRVERATFDAAAVVSAAEAKREQLLKGGALAEQDQVRADLARQRRVALAESISKIPAPRVVILGGDGANANGGGGSNTRDALMNLLLLKQVGVDAAAAKRAPAK